MPQPLVHNVREMILFGVDGWASSAIRIPGYYGDVLFPQVVVVRFQNIAGFLDELDARNHRMDPSTHTIGQHLCNLI